MWWINFLFLILYYPLLCFLVLLVSEFRNVISVLSLDFFQKKKALALDNPRAEGERTNVGTPLLL